MTEYSRRGIQRIADISRDFGSIWNTVILVVGLGYGVYEMGANSTANDKKFAEVDRDVQQLNASQARYETAAAQRWIAHDELHKNRLAEVKEKEGRDGARLKAIEDELRKSDSLSYRVQQLEQTTGSVTETLKDVQTLISSQGGDLKVVREILQRLEAQQRVR